MRGLLNIGNVAEAGQDPAARCQRQRFRELMEAYHDTVKSTTRIKNKIKSKFSYDDSLDAFGVHGIGGLWGALATGLWATKSVVSSLEYRVSVSTLPSA